MKLLVKFNLVLIAVFAVGIVPAGILSRNLLQKNARTQVLQDARIMMETALAVRGYTVNQVAPLLKDRLEEKFLPQTVPAYSATEVFNALRQSNPAYTYKEATLNPTNPRDRVVDWEADVVNAFRNDPAKKEIIGDRQTPEGPSLFLSHPIQIKDEKCLSCHTSPETSPASVVKTYGTSNGFGWKMGEVVGAQIVQVPTSLPVGMADQAFRTLMLSLVSVFLATLVVLNVLLEIVIVRPLRRLSQMADRVSLGELDVPEVEVKGRDEVAMLAGSFSRMRISLRKALALLDEE